MKLVNRNKTNVATKLNVATDIATNTAITVLALAGTGIAAPAIGLWSGILAGTTGVVIAGVYTANTIVTIKENF
jgi:hypothetical protein